MDVKARAASAKIELDSSRIQTSLFLLSTVLVSLVPSSELLATNELVRQAGESNISDPRDSESTIIPPLKPLTTSKPLPIRPISSKIPSSLFLLSTILLSTTYRNSLVQENTLILISASDRAASDTLSTLSTLDTALASDTASDTALGRAEASDTASALIPIQPSSSRIPSSLFLLSTILLSTTYRNSLVQENALIPISASASDRAASDRAASDTVLASDTASALIPIQPSSSRIPSSLFLLSTILLSTTYRNSLVTPISGLNTASGLASTYQSAPQQERTVQFAERASTRQADHPLLVEIELESSRITSSLFLLSTILVSLVSDSKALARNELATQLQPQSQVQLGQLGQLQLQPKQQAIVQPVIDSSKMPTGLLLLSSILLSLINKNSLRSTPKQVAIPDPGTSKGLINIMDMKLNSNPTLKEKLNKIDKIIDDNISNITSLNDKLQEFAINITETQICITIK